MTDKVHPIAPSPRQILSQSDALATALTQVERAHLTIANPKNFKGDNSYVPEDFHKIDRLLDEAYIAIKQAMTARDRLINTAFFHPQKQPQSTLRIVK